MVSIGKKPRGTLGLRELETSAIAFAQDGNIWVNKANGRISEFLNNANNLVSVLVHENAHKMARHGEAGSKISTLDAEKHAYTTQVSHSSFAKTTKDFQWNTLGGYASYLKTSKSSYSSINNMVNDFNQNLPKEAFYKLKFKANFQSFEIDIIENENENEKK